MGRAYPSSCRTVFLFTIYTPESLAPLPKLGLMQVCVCTFSQPEGIPSGTKALRPCLFVVTVNPQNTSITCTEIYRHKPLHKRRHVSTKK